MKFVTTLLSLIGEVIDKLKETKYFNKFGDITTYESRKTMNGKQHS